MALVAYGSSGSESESDYDEQPSVPTIAEAKNTASASGHATATPESTNTANNVAAIIDDEDDESIDAPDRNVIAFNLPAPKVATVSNRPTANASVIIEEEDDEFLRKKATAYPIERPPPPPKPLTLPAVRGPVKIVLPALATFAEHKQKEKPEIGAQLPSNRPTGLVQLLPKPKSMQHLGHKTSATSGKSSMALVPDSIARPKKPTQMPTKKPTTTTSALKKTTESAASAKVDSDTDDNSDAEDFFSLQTDDTLPEVSADEIAAMVASKSAQMTRAARQAEINAAAAEAAAVEQSILDASSNHDPTASGSTNPNVGGAMDRQAIEALCGSRQAKRARHVFGSKAGGEMSNIIDISGDQVLPDRDEWMRTQLQATTEYQPRGLVDGDPGAGTKRKHQITYLAHQAKANEQELQAMWAANRHTKRQTQNKYGF